MVKKLLLCVAATLCMASASAQRMGMNNHEIAVTYGAVPVSTWVNSFSDQMLNILLDVDSNVKDWGAVSVGYNYRFSKRISLGGQLVFASNRNEIRKFGVSIDNSYVTILPNLKISWANWRIVSLYSRVGAGVTFTQSKGDSDIDGQTETQSSTLFGYQISLLGVDVGGRLGGFAEAGIGVSGSILAGIRYRF